jgi:hypothetical protein
MLRLLMSLVLPASVRVLAFAAGILASAAPAAEAAKPAAEAAKPGAIATPRGRAVINAERTTLVADNGNRLRGACFVPRIEGLRQLKALGMNTVHHYAEGFDPTYPAPGSRAPGYNREELDRFVAMTRDLGLYFVFTIGGEGKFNHQSVIDFWKLYALRYAHETHVIYEIDNEPVAWSPPYSDPGANPRGAIEMNVEAWQVIRAAAPDTPVLIFSYSQMGGTGGGQAALRDIAAFSRGLGRDERQVWGNTAVAFHGYAGHQATAEAAREVLAGGYPILMSEFYTHPWGIGGYSMQDIELTEALEQLGVSWLSFLYTPPAPWGMDVTVPKYFKDPIDRAGISWKPDVGSWPRARGAFGNGGRPRDVGVWEKRLTGKTQVECEDFDHGGEGVACHDTTPEGNEGKAHRPDQGVDIFATTGGGVGAFVRADQDEWVEYRLAVRDPGHYEFALRYANAAAGTTVRLSLGGTAIATLPLKNAAGGAWSTATHRAVLDYGLGVLRVEVAQGRADLDRIEITPVADGPIASGIYKILNRSSGLALATSKPDANHVVQALSTGDKSLLWHFEHLGAGQYRITSEVHRGLWNRIYWGSDGISLVHYGYDGPDRLQRFLVRDGGDGYHRLAPVDAGFDVVVNAAQDGARLTQGGTAFAGEASRQWAIVAPAALGIAANVTAERAAAGILLKWQAVPGASGYVVKRSEAPGGPATTFRVSGNQTTYTDRSAPKARSCRYGVCAVDAQGEGPVSLMATPPQPHASYAFDQDAGAAVDGVKGAWNGILAGTPQHGPGRDGQALILDGGDDHVAFPAGMVSTLQECTVAAWIRLDGPRKWARLIDFGIDQETCLYLAPVNGDDVPHFALRVKGREAKVTGGKPIATDRWVHVAAVIKDGMGTLFIDGDEAGRGTGFETPQAMGKTTSNLLGKSQFPDPLLKARIDDLRIYANGMSRADIRALAQTPPAKAGR